MAQVSYGTITITDTNDIERIYTVYAKSSTNTDVPTAAASDWKELISEAPGSGNYIWQRTVVQKSGTQEKSYSDPVCLTGEEGESAKNIIAIEVQYGISANWNTQPSSWSENTPNYDSSKPNYWTRTRLKYEGNTYSSWVANKDYALTEAIYNSVVANSIAQHANEDSQGAMSQAASNLNSIVRLWYAKANSTAPAAPTSGITTGSASTYNAWSTVKPANNSSYQYYFYCDQSCTGGGVYSWSNVVLDTSTLSQYQIGALTTKVKNFWWDSTGAHVASGKNGNEVTTSTISTYGYHALMGLTGISFNYDSAKVVDLNSTTPSLDFYQPPTISGSTVTQGKKTMMLSANALRFYSPSDGTTEQAVLDTNGLILKKGGIKVGTVGSNNGIYISSDNLGSVISSLVPTPSGGTPKTNWRAVIGSKFGVDSEGNLYANNAKVTGDIVATSLTIGSGSSAYNGAAAINISGYDIQITQDSTGAAEGTTYLIPHLYHNGVEVTSGIDYTKFVWYQDNVSPGTEGDASHQGRYLATYGHNYRVTYDFNDGAVQGGTTVETRYIDPSKYITKINDTGITVHPEDTSSGQNILINSSGVQIRKGTLPMMNLDNDSLDFNTIDAVNNTYKNIASFGETTRIGYNNETKMVLSSNSFDMVDVNGLSISHIGNPTNQLLLDVFFYDSTQTDPNIFVLSEEPTTIEKVTINDEETTNYTLHDLKQVTINDTLTDDDKISITYKFAGEASYYTFGYRKDGGGEDEEQSFIVGEYSFAAGCYLSATGTASHAEGYGTEAKGHSSHAEGHETIAWQDHAHVEGDGCQAEGEASHAEGSDTVARGRASHAEGDGCQADGPISHAEGWRTYAKTSGSHAEGIVTYANGSSSHAEGFETYANGENSHAEGDFTHANGENSHAQNKGTTAEKSAQTTLGTYNIKDTASTTTHPNGDVNYGQYSFIIGNGTSNTARSNAFTVDWNGNVNIPSGASYQINGVPIGNGKVALPTAKKNWTISENRTDARTYRLLSAFTTTSNSNSISDDNVFGSGTDGFICKKRGWYYFYTYMHFNTTVNATDCYFRIYDYTHSTSIVSDQHCVTSTTYATNSSGSLYYAPEDNTLVVVEFAKYTNNTTTGWRPTFGGFGAIALEGTITPTDESLPETVSEAQISTFSSGWAVYDDTTTAKVTVRKYGRMCTLTGRVRNTVAKTLNTTGEVVFNVPEGYRPLQTCQGIFQGTDTAVWHMIVNPEGGVSFSRYRLHADSYPSIAVGSWFPFHITYISAD